MENGFAVTAFISVILNLILPEEFGDDEEIPEITANSVDEQRDEEEWRHIKREDQDAIMPQKA